MRPENYRYTSSHEWVRFEENIATVGITDFAVSELGDLVHVELPEPDSVVVSEESFGEVESFKTVAELISPFSGKIVAVNEDLEDDIDLLAVDPFEKGWLIRIDVSDPDQQEELLSVADYNELVADDEENESHELDDDE